MPNEDIKTLDYSKFNKYFTKIDEEEAKYLIDNAVNVILKSMKSRQLWTFNNINN